MPRRQPLSLGCVQTRPACRFQCGDVRATTVPCDPAGPGPPVTGELGTEGGPQLNQAPAPAFCRETWKDVKAVPGGGAMRLMGRTTSSGFLFPSLFKSRIYSSLNK